MAEKSTNQLISTKQSDSGLRVLLHPLVLLTISDYITRHILRRRTTALVGALIGQQNGREISLEHAFEVEVIQEHGTVRLHETWFKERLQQYKDVHKAPALDLVGWFTTAPVTGPQPEHLDIHQHIIQNYNETAVLLAFHPSSVLGGSTVDGKLPLAIYESFYENEGGEMDRTMLEDGQEAPLAFRFNELPYSIETGEAEMISVDFVARGGGNATAINGSGKTEEKKQSQKTKAATQEQEQEHDYANGVDDSANLSPEDEELIAALTTRANAVKMLHSRIQLLKSYLSEVPPCYLTNSKPTESAHQPEIKHPILRSIQALINRLSLLIPADQKSFDQESLTEKTDVSLVELLGNIGKSVYDTKVLGSKFGVIENAAKSSKKGAGAYGGAMDGFINGPGDSALDDRYMMT
ncbi:MAG: hypothetical protein MMC33_009025 [Icmadophila ericetorum]|nr:hypothetical protein [Icmadophila ericetorum]